MDAAKILLPAIMLFFTTSAQAKAVNSWTDLEFVHRYVTPNPRHTADEWNAIFAAAEKRIAEDITGLVNGTVPQNEGAGKVFVEPADRIIAGSPATQGQIPWQALLILGGSGLCGGSLISNHIVLTAAHCVQSVASFQITLGATSRQFAQAGAVTQATRLALVHAAYNPRMLANDIALLRLPAGVAFTNFINAVRLPRWAQASNSFAGAAARVSGFGRINSANNAVSPNLLFADVTVVANAACARTFGAQLLASNICTAGASGRSPCNMDKSVIRVGGSAWSGNGQQPRMRLLSSQGDSGGPLVIREADGQFTVVGVVSFGVQNCPAGFPAAFVRVTSYLNWISSGAGIAIRP